MKKAFLLSTLLGAATIAAQAQTTIPKGTVSLGGSVGYSYSSDEYKSTLGSGSSTKYSTSSFSISPYVGFFVADNLSIGLNVSYASSKPEYSGSNIPDASPKATTNFQIGPFVQYYNMLSEQFGLVGTLSAGYEHTSRPATSNSVGLTGSGFYSGITPSIVFFPIPKFSIGASIGSLGYSRLSIDSGSSTSEETLTDLGVNFGLSQLQFSGTYYFGR